MNLDELVSYIENTDATKKQATA